MAIGFLNTPSTTYIAAAIVVVVSRILPVAYWLVIGDGPAAYHCISDQLKGNKITTADARAVDTIMLCTCPK